MNSLLAAIAGAIMASGLAGWFWGFWWGVFAYVTSGALILLTFGIVRASTVSYTHLTLPTNREV